MTRTQSQPRRFGLEAGITLMELMASVVVLVLVISIASRPLARSTQRSRVNRAAAVVAGDLELAFALAGRQRAPVRIVFDSTGMQYSLTDRRTGTVYRSRTLGAGSDFTLSTLRFAPAVVDVFPTGLASGPLAVTVGASGYNRQVTMTRASTIRGAGGAL